MKTFLKVLLFVMLALVALKFLPALLFPFVVAGLGCLLILAVLASGVAAVASVGLCVLAGVVAIALAGLAVLSPIWIPVLAIAGLIALIKRASRA